MTGRLDEAGFADFLARNLNLNPSDIEAGLREYYRDLVINVSLWGMGDLSFEEDRLPPCGSITTCIFVEDLLHQALSVPDRIDEVIRMHLAPECMETRVLRTGLGQVCCDQFAGLSYFKIKTLINMKDFETIADLSSAMNMERREFSRILFDMVTLQLVKIVSSDRSKLLFIQKNTAVLYPAFWD